MPLGFKPWEPEEAVGSLWHRVVGRLDERPAFPDAAVALPAMQARIGIVFRGLGGEAGVEFRDATAEGAQHRRSFWRRLGHAEEAIERPSFDGEVLRLPASLDALPERALNEQLYLWLAAFAAHDEAPPPEAPDPLRADLLTLRHAQATIARLLTGYPGLRPDYLRLCREILALRARRQRPEAEQALEDAIRALLGDSAAPSGAAGRYLDLIQDEATAPDAVTAPPGYRCFEPVLLWPERRPAPTLDRGPASRDETGAGSGQAPDGKRKRAARKKSDQVNRKDSLILHRFESMLSWADFLNLNRRVEDDDPETAKKAADDAEELGLADVDQRPATRLAFDLDLAPRDLDSERLAGEELLPEWDYRGNRYLADHVRILEARGDSLDQADGGATEPVARWRIAAVKRQFEALRPRRRTLTRQIDGEELDMEGVVRSLVDLRASGDGSNRVYRQIVNDERDLAVATLIDCSRSTESAVGERAVIDVAREALSALGHGLAAVGDSHAIYSFSSLKRHRVYVNRLKGFEEPMSRAVERRIAALKPGFYTRLGAAIRAVAKPLKAQGASRRLLLVITDGKPNDLDHYEGRYGVEDSRMAVTEARRLGHAVFGITIDKRAETYIPRIFGQNGYCIVSRPERLTSALPLIYRHLVT